MTVNHDVKIDRLELNARRPAALPRQAEAAAFVRHRQANEIDAAHVLQLRSVGA